MIDVVIIAVSVVGLVWVDNDKWVREKFLGWDMPFNVMFLKIPEIWHTYLRIKYSEDEEEQED